MRTLSKHLRFIKICKMREERRVRHSGGGETNAALVCKEAENGAGTTVRLLLRHPELRGSIFNESALINGIKRRGKKLHLS